VKRTTNRHNIKDAVAQNTVAEKCLYSEEILIIIWFTDKKMFAVATPQTRNGRMYAPEAVKKKDVSAKCLRT